MHKRTFHSLSFAALLFSLSACRNSGQAPEFDFPGYASPTNVNGFLGWTVKCPLQTISNPQSTDTSIFYNADGSEKTLAQFCDEYDASTRIQQQPRQ